MRRAPDGRVYKGPGPSGQNGNPGGRTSETEPGYTLRSLFFMQYIVIAAYFAVLLVIGAVAARRVHDLSDYYVGGKRLRYWVVAFSARATGESAWLYLGLTGLGALVGLRTMWVVVGEVLGVGIAWFLMAAPFKRATDQFRSITVPDYLVSRFLGAAPSPRIAALLRLVAAGSLALFVTIYVSAQIDATGKAFNSFLGWNYYVGALVGFGIVVAYTFSGGFIAVSWSDLFQGLLMLVGLLLLPIGALAAIGGGVDLGSGLAGLADGFTSIWGPGGLTLSNLLIVIAYAAIGLGFLGSPQVFVRFISIRDEQEIRAGRWVALAFTILTDGGAVVAGMLGRYLLVGPDGNFVAQLGADGERVLPGLVNGLFPPVVGGLYVAAVLAAIMSTIDSLLVVASSAITRDMYQQTWKPHVTNESLIRLSRWVTLLLAALALSVSLAVSFLYPGRTIFWYVIFGWSGIAATFCPMIVLSLLWPRYNVYGAFASMLTGLLAVPAFKFGFPLLPVWGPYISLVEELAPSFVLALLAGIVATYITAKK